MALAVWNPPDTQTAVVRRVASAQFGRPCLDLLQDTREYLEKCVPIYKLALKGDWRAAKSLIDDDGRLMNAAITKGWSTLLHVAAGANQVHFVEELLSLLHRYDLELQDYNGNTAFCIAAAVGNVRIANIMMDKNASLPTIRGAQGMTALHMAALQGRIDMARHFYSLTVHSFHDDTDWIILFFLCINTGIYDLALQMLEREPILLASARDGSNELGLHVLARKPSGFTSQGRDRCRLMNSCTKSTQFLQLVRCLWSIILHLDQSDIEMTAAISEPWQVIFGAAEDGNSEFLAELVGAYPDLIWEVDDKDRTIIHIAVLHRHAKIFNLIHEIGSIKDLIVTFVDDQQNNMLHCAAKLAPPTQLCLISGAAFQMMHELLWFEEVKKIMLPSFIEMKNSNGLTARQLFTKEHAELLKRAESWMKGTADSCMLVSTLITTGVFSAAFTIPGGTNDITGAPNYLEKPSFLVFAISDATALISSSTSILIFLSILISRYAEDDFLKSLPLKLIFGLVMLFISIISMMVAFSTTFFIAYYHGLKWVPSFISGLAFLPIFLFLFLQFPLWSDIVYSIYFCKSLFRPTKHLLH